MDTIWSLSFYTELITDGLNNAVYAYKNQAVSITPVITKC